MLIFILELMPSRSWLKNLLLGHDFIEPKSDYKYALLRGHLGLVLWGICFLYIFIDIFNGIYVFILWYIVGMSLASYVIFENRQKHYTRASIVFLTTANSIVYLFSAVDHPESGIFLFYIATSAAALVLFHKSNRNVGYMFVFISIFLAILAYLGDWSPVERPQTGEVIRKVNFLINFLLGLSASVIILVFIIERNKESEGSLLSNQRELEQITDELKRSKDRFESAVKGAGAGIYEWDISTNSVYVSPRWKELLGYSDDDGIEVNLEFFMGLVHQDDAVHTGKNIERAISVGGGYQNELRMRTKAGEYRWFRDTGIITYEISIPSKAVGSIIDINDRKHAEVELREKNEELEKTNDELDRFVYSASHDMRAPLSTLLGLLEVAKNTDKKSELNQYFDLMRDRIYTMEGFIREITDYSRNARLAVERTSLLLKPIINECVESFNFLANESHVKVEVSCNEDVMVTTDRSRLSVILNNLISNSIKYHDPEKEERIVTIAVERTEDNCKISIKDNGIGIDAQYKDQVFDMFFRASENSKGSGLGLYIVKETAEKVGAEISFTSVLGKGSEFSLTIPAHQSS